MEWQESALWFFSNIHTPVLNSLAQLITILGEQYVLIAVMLCLYWCFDKKRGIVASSALMTSISTAEIIKAIVRFPRPWTLCDFDVVREETATGYSFPSGHTANASAAYFSLARTSKRKWAKVCLCVIVFLIGLSRLYLCVHWPMDVLCALCIGALCSFFVVRLIDRLYENKRIFCVAFTGLGTVVSASALIMGIFLTWGHADPDSYTDLSKTLAFFGGIAIAAAFERYFCDFKIEQGHILRKVLRLVIGVAGVFVLLVASKPLLLKLGLYNPFSAQLRYFITAMWIGAWPIIGKRAGLFE